MIGAAACTPGVARSAHLAWQPLKLVGGSPVVFEVNAPAGTRAVSGIWLQHEITFFPITRSSSLMKMTSPRKQSLTLSDSHWYCLAGIPLETVPGAYPLKINELLRDGTSRELSWPIGIGRAFFPKITVKVARQYTEPSPEQLRQINLDKDLKQRIFASENPERRWDGPFLAPVSAAISDVFGTARIFNGAVQSRHLGLDYAVSSGTAVDSVNAGLVILARPLYFEGNCVVIDHGQGLLSLYLHLSEFKVKEGEQVRKGQLIGLSGGTGRASGPHLHLAIRWRGVYLNPQTLLQLRLPVPAAGVEGLF
ncbi:MAG: M23 family metallopeptidase [Acidobacteria bacterium]|nr:M23 family metallopeptidase [Acidobacteriota bacterium]